MERSRFTLIWYSHRSLTRSSKFLVLPTLSRNAKVERVDQAYITTGAIQPAGAAATFTLLPLAQKILERITHIIDEELTAIDAQKVSFPSLSSSKTWRTTGRWDSYGPVLFRLEDRAKAPLCLGPTHEETVTQCVATIGAADITPKLPLKLYQTNWKYRDEPRPKQGLMRAREFLMNDMYSFHASEADCRATYDQVTEAYHRIFSRFGLPFVRATAVSGEM
ncbi:putative proline--tRNA ligase, partial [Tropilaelaps mercedesae]